MPVSVSCGAHHTAVITRRGDLITWGAGTAGQTGQGVSTDVCFLLPSNLMHVNEKLELFHAVLVVVLSDGAHFRHCVQSFAVSAPFLCADTISQKGSVSLR